MENRDELLQEIMEVSFAADDAKLYLDTHPDDAQALEYFQECINRRKTALAQYAGKFEPLMVDCHSDPVGHFRWIDGPVPWEGGHEHVGI